MIDAQTMILYPEAFLFSFLCLLRTDPICLVPPTLCSGVFKIRAFARLICPDRKEEPERIAVMGADETFFRNKRYEDFLVRRTRGRDRGVNPFHIAADFGGRDPHVGF